VKGSRVFWIIMAVALVGAIALAAALKHQQTLLREKRQRLLAPIPATR